MVATLHAVEIVPREGRIEQLLAQRFEWTQRQREVLDLLARSKSNAEIADTLDISLDGAKWHMREILSKLGVDSREDAAEYWRRYNGWPEKLRRAARFVWTLPLSVRVAGGGAAAMLASGTLLLITLDAGADRDSQATTPATDASTTSPSLVVLDNQAMFDLGQFFMVDGEASPVAGWDARESLLVVTLKGSGRLQLTSEHVRWQIYGTGPGAMSMYAYVGDNRYTMNVFMADNQSIYSLPPESTSVAFVHKNTGQPVFLVQVFLGEGPYGNDSDQMYHATVDDRGQLFLARDLVAPSYVVDRYTGERINVEGAPFVGSLPSPHWTHCNSDGCIGTWSSGTSSLRAPATGTFHCSEAGRFEVRTHEVVLQFREIPRIQGQGVQSACPLSETRRVAAGDDIAAPGIYRITATADRGEGLSVGITGAGDIHVGKLRATVACPCIGGVTEDTRFSD